MRCPVCSGLELYASHRKGFVERGPLSWIGILPYRCGECQTRFYTWTGRRVHGRTTRELSDTRERSRPARWPHTDQVSVQVVDGRQRSSSIVGETANLSLKGMRLRLPINLPEGSQLSLALKEAAARTGTVRWSRADGGAGFVYGVQLDTPFGRRARLVRPWRRLRRRQLLRRLALYLVGVVLMVGAAWGLVWLVDVFQAYNPNYYEPKDIERQLHESLQRGRGGPSAPPR